MKTTAAQKKKIAKLAERAVFSVFQRVVVLCPVCGQTFGEYQAESLNYINRFVQSEDTCPSCQTLVTVLAPIMPIRKQKEPKAAAEPEKTAEITEEPVSYSSSPPPVYGTENADPPPNTGASEGRADFVKDAVPPTQQWYEGARERREVPMFGTTEEDINKVVDTLPGEPPKFPFWRSAFTGAAIAVLFMGAVIAGAYLWHVPLPKPTPAVQPTATQGWTSLAICPPGGTCAVTTEPPTTFGFELTMNEDAWVQVEVDGRESLPGYILKKGANHIWFDVNNVKVRCGKPGAVTYLVNGRKISPKNAAEKPDKVEVVNLTAGVTLGKEAYPKD